MRKQILTQSTLLTLGNLAAGFLHYLFQVLAARKLSTTDLGVLNVSMAYFSLATIFAQISQFWAVFSTQSNPSLRWMRLFSGVIFVSTLAFGFLFWSRPIAGPLLHLFIFLGVPAAIVAQYWQGFFQKTKAFYAFGLFAFLIGATKWVGALFSESLHHFFITVVLSFACILPWQAWINRQAKDTSPSDLTSSSFSLSLGLSLLTGLGWVLLPVYDLLNVQYWIGTSAAGDFSKIQLFSKILFFAPASLLQVTLPYYTELLRYPGRQATGTQRTLRQIEWMGLTVCYLAVFFFGLTGQWISQNLLGIPSLSSYDIFLASLSVPPLYGVLGSIQIFASAKKPRMCVIFLAPVLLSMGVCSFIPWQNLSQYLVYSASFNTLLGGVAWGITSRWIWKSQIS